MSGFVLGSLIQHSKDSSKCFTSSPQDAMPVEGLHSSAHGQKDKAVPDGWELRVVVVVVGGEL